MTQNNLTKYTIYTEKLSVILSFVSRKVHEVHFDGVCGSEIESRRRKQVDVVHCVDGDGNDARKRETTSVSTAKLGMMTPLQTLHEANYTQSTSPSLL